MQQQQSTGRRAPASELEAILGNAFYVLDDGFVRAIDYMGSDDAVVQAARISYGQGTKKVHEDRGLIRYLMRNRHTTPFEMCEIKLHVRVPMDCWRQWIRHRTANVNEYSTRYSEAIDVAQSTAPTDWRLQAPSNRQGSAGAAAPEVGESLSSREKELHDMSRAVYEDRLQHGIAREQARKDLPLSTYTEAYWKIDLHNLLHFLSLRMHSHAQAEIRAYAETIGHKIVARWCPVVWEAFCDYRLNSVFFSRVELEILRAVVAGDPNRAEEIAKAAGLVTFNDAGMKRSRERQELEAKLNGIGLRLPWQETPSSDSR